MQMTETKLLQQQKKDKENRRHIFIMLSIGLTQLEFFLKDKNWYIKFQFLQKRDKYTKII
jgi:hypothetical protein